MTTSLLGVRNKHCELCNLHTKARQVCVMGTGSYRRPVFVVGEAPGFQEDQMGRPFVGRSGKLLRSELSRVGINAEQVYLTNTVKCFPDGPPSEEETEICSGVYLRKELELLKPEWILAVGSPAFRTLTKSTETITSARAQLWDCKMVNGPFVFPTFHPAYVLRNKPKLLNTFQGDLELFAATIQL